MANLKDLYLLAADKYQRSSIVSAEAYASGFRYCLVKQLTVCIINGGVTTKILPLNKQKGLHSTHLSFTIET